MVDRTTCDEALDVTLVVKDSEPTILPFTPPDAPAVADDIKEVIADADDDTEDVPDDDPDDDEDDDDDEEFVDANGIIESPNGAVLKTHPGPLGQSIITLPNGTFIQIIGKTGLDDFWDVVIEDGTTGFINITQVDTDLDINTVPITFHPEGGPPPNAPPPRNNGG